MQDQKKSAKFTTALGVLSAIILSGLGNSWFGDSWQRVAFPISIIMLFCFALFFAFKNVKSWKAKKEERLHQQNDGSKEKE